MKLSNKFDRPKDLLEILQSFHQKDSKFSSKSQANNPEIQKMKYVKNQFHPKLDQEVFRRLMEFLS